MFACAAHTSSSMDSSTVQADPQSSHRPPVAMIVCNTYAHIYEGHWRKSHNHNSSPYPLGILVCSRWHTYQLNKEQVYEFMDHLNSLDPYITFTTEEEQDGALAFLHINIVWKEDGVHKVTIYRKSTHTDKCPSFQSNHASNGNWVWLEPYTTEQGLW